MEHFRRELSKRRVFGEFPPASNRRDDDGLNGLACKRCGIVADSAFEESGYFHLRRIINDLPFGNSAA